MNILDIFKFNSKKSASKAKERLQIVVSHQRAAGSSDLEFLPKLRQELMTVISKYTNIEQDKIQVQLQEEGEFSVLELNITLPTSAAAVS